LEPESWNIRIPSTGGNFTYQGKAGNYNLNERSGDLWITLTHPDESEEELRHVSGTAAAGQIIPFEFVESMPAAYDPGVYKITSHIGRHPDLPVASDTFLLVKEHCPQ
jgi:hypothetical protein